MTELEGVRRPPAGAGRALADAERRIAGIYALQGDRERALAARRVAAEAYAANALPGEAAAERLIALTSSVAAKPRAFWGAYGASKAALETLIQAYAEENRATGRIKAAIVDPGATRTKMRSQAYPGEDPQSVKEPEVVAAQIVELLSGAFESGTRVAVNQSR